MKKCGSTSTKIHDEAVQTKRRAFWFESRTSFLVTDSCDNSLAESFVDTLKIIVCGKINNKYQETDKSLCL